MYKNKKNGIIGIIITVIILILIVIFSNGDQNSNFLQNAVNNFVMPIQNGLTFLKNKLSGNNAFFSDLDYLKDENKKLKEKNNELEQSLRELENIKTENQTLKEYMNLAEKYKEYKTIPGYIINKDISNYSKTMVINLGKKDGVEVNMTVIGNEGLVGHVISVTDSTAKVQTIIDTASSVSCSMSTTKDSIVCKGTLEEKSALKAMYIPTDANIIQNDSIETSGIGGIYPKGIHIGTVKKVTNTQNMTDRYALIETAVNFDKIDTVLVIANK